jgi:SAM-dependent methyltransferase
MEIAAELKMSFGFLKIQILFVVLLLTPLAKANLICEDLLRENSTALLQLSEYQQPNQRGLDIYNAVFLTEIEYLVPNHGVAIDLGGGLGRAYHELTLIKPVAAIVINTQEFHPPWPSTNAIGSRFSYQQGWAEQELSKFENVDLITDLWGAFSYSIYKAELIEQIYRSLKPGGRAMVLFSPSKTPTKVKSKSGQILDFHVWLQKKFPKLIRVQRGGHDMQSAFVINITKDRWKSLELKLYRTNHEYTRYSNNNLPSVEYLEL